MLRLRAQQDETGGFLAFIPLAFHPENTVFERRGFKFTTGADDLKMIAVSRLLLDNIPNVKAYWIMMGMPMAQVALHFGANDVQGTVVREQIFQAAGATSGTEQKIGELVRDVQEAAAFPFSATRSTTSCGGGERRRLIQSTTRRSTLLRPYPPLPPHISTPNTIPPILRRRLLSHPHLMAHQ